jgi:hypothetical protein
MAGTFTHWMIVEEVLDRFNKLPDKHPYFPIILSNNHFIILGAVGPDYPYLSELTNNLLKLHSWADRMHYENTGDFVKYGIANLLKLKDQNKQQDFEICLSWLCGYVTHLLADSIIHPVVNAIVGPYLFNSGEHRHCEMIQDSYIFHEVKDVEIRYADYVDLIKMCSGEEDEDLINPAIRDFWTETLKISHPGGKDKFNKIDPHDWHENFLSMINKAAEPLPVFRHVGQKRGLRYNISHMGLIKGLGYTIRHMGQKINLVYKKISEITQDERKKFIDKINLPGNKVGKFKEDAFYKAVEKVIDVWQKLFIDIEQKNPENCASYIKNWNLDTGVDEDGIYFWA